MSIIYYLVQEQALVPSEETEDHFRVHQTLLKKCLRTRALKVALTSDSVSTFLPEVPS